MKLSHSALLILVAAIWGTNFVAIRLGLNQVPPITFSAMRFFFVIFPAIFFVKKPDLPLRKIAAYGAVMFAAQFAFSFCALQEGMSAGLASLVLQVQAFFTIALAAFFLKEKPLLYQILGACLAGCGIMVVASHVGGEVTLFGLLLSGLAALSWGGGNILSKTFGKIDMFGLVIWGGLFAFPLLTLLAFGIEGSDAVIHGIQNVNLTTFLALTFIVYLSTFVAFTLWGRMLAQYPTAMVAPFSLLVPVFGMLSSALILHEAYPLWKFVATLLIIAGLGINQFGGKLMGTLRRKFGTA